MRPEDLAAFAAGAAVIPLSRVVEEHILEGEWAARQQFGLSLLLQNIAKMSRKSDGEVLYDTYNILYVTDELTRRLHVNAKVHPPDFETRLEAFLQEHHFVQAKTAALWPALAAGLLAGATLQKQLERQGDRILDGFVAEYKRHFIEGHARVAAAKLAIYSYVAKRYEAQRFTCALHLHDLQLADACFELLTEYV